MDFIFVHLSMPAGQGKIVNKISYATPGTTYVARCNLAHGLRVRREIKNFLMKNNSLFALILLAVLAARAQAAEARSEADLVVLPTYVIQAPRYQPAEELVNASLNELRQQAHRSVPIIALELPVLKARVVQPAALARAMLDQKVLRLAKS